MSNFPLQTETERKLYIEALFVCLSRGAINAQRATSDLVDLATQSPAGGLTPTSRQALVQRTEGIMAAYESGAIDRPVAAANFEALLTCDKKPDKSPLARGSDILPGDMLVRRR